jgi:hypothetical protein
MKTIDIDSEALSRVMGGAGGQPITCTDVMNRPNPRQSVSLIQQAVKGETARNMRPAAIANAQERIRAGHNLKTICNDAVSSVD